MLGSNAIDETYSPRGYVGTIYLNPYQGAFVTPIKANTNSVPYFSCPYAPRYGIKRVECRRMLLIVRQRLFGGMAPSFLLSHLTSHSLGTYDI